MPNDNQLTTTAATERFSLAQRKATALAASSLVPTAYQGNPANCLLALELAERLGVQPLMVVQNLHIISGKPSWSSTFLIAVLNSSKLFSPIRFRSKKDAEGNEWAWRAVATDLATGEVLEGPAVTLEMARAEGWSTKHGNKWKTMPDVMGRYRAAAFFARLYAPEQLMGLLAQEEVEDITRAPSEPRNVTEILAGLAAPQNEPVTELEDSIPGLTGDDTAPTPVPPEARREGSPVHAPTVPTAAGESSEPKQSEADFGADPVALPGTFADPDLARMFAGQEAAAHAYLVNVKKWLKPDQPLTALSAENLDYLKSKHKAFAAAANLTIQS